MATYRYVCPHCTAFIRSRDEREYESLEAFWEDWNVSCDQWDAEHVCGQDDGIGIEKPSRFAAFTDDRTEA